MAQRIAIWILCLFVFLVVFTILLPLALSVGAGELASAAGCTLNEGQEHSCVIWGYDIGSLLLSIFSLGWVAVTGIGMLLMAAPFVGVAILVLSITAFVRKRTKHSQS